MKKIFLFLFFTLTSYLSFSQSTYSNLAVTYKVAINHQEFPQNNNLEVKARLQKLFKIIPNLEFSLLSNKEASIFRINNILSSDYTGSHNSAISLVGGKGQYYKSEEVNLVHQDLFGELVNIEIENDYIWEITQERKDIMGYSCFRANSSYQTIDRDGKEVVVEVYVWFTPEINFSEGPLGFNNLPGLVLEATKNNRYTFYATIIEIGPKDNLKIEKPNPSRTITEAEYESIVAEKLKKIRNGGF